MSEVQECEKKESGRARLKKENFLVLLLIGVLLLVIVWPMPEEKTQKEQNESIISDMKSDMLTESTKFSEKAESIADEQDWIAYAAYLEEALEEVLSAMEGAGRVKVMITLKNSAESVVEKDITTGLNTATQVSGEGSSQNSGDKEEARETVYIKDNDCSIPYVKQVICPQIAGVVVCAQGGDNQRINKNITEAIQALFGIEAHKIKIIKMTSNE